MIPSYKQLNAWCAFLAGEGFRYILTAVFAGIGAFLAALYADAQKTEQFRNNLNRSGIGYPAVLFYSAEKEDSSLSVDFSPPELQRVAVCEYHFDRQETFRDLMEKYLERYSACFVPVWSSEDDLEVRPNRFGDQLVETMGGGKREFWCKCKPEQIPPGRVIVSGAD